MKKTLFFLTAILSLVLFAVIIIATDMDSIPDGIRQIYQFPGGDKVGHIVIMGVVSFGVLLSIRAVISRKYIQQGTLISLIILILIFTLEEFSQIRLPQRTFSWLDLVCSYSGTALGTALALFFTRKRLKEPVA